VTRGCSFSIFYVCDHTLLSTEHNAQSAQGEERVGGHGTEAWRPHLGASRMLAGSCPRRRKDVGNPQQKAVARPVLDRNEGEDSRSRSLAGRDPDPDRQGTPIVKLHVLNRCNPDSQAFRQLRHLHCVDLDDLPYRKTYALPISHYRRVSPISYMHPRGAIGNVKYA